MTRCVPNCEGCWLSVHDGHDVGTRREDGRLIAATCHDCQESYDCRVSYEGATDGARDE